MKNFILKIKKLFKKLDINSNNILLYLCSGEALPETLSEEEERMYVKMNEEGNEIGRQKLIEHNLRLVVYVAKKFSSTELETEDLISIGSLGLIKAVNTYRSDKNIKLATYASKCIENEILMYLRKVSRQRQMISLDEPLNIDNEGNELILFDLIPCEENSPQDSMDKSTEKKILWRVIDKLNAREKEIMLLRFGLSGGDELTQKEVADSLGISQSYISRLEKKIVVRMKKEINKLA